MDRIKGMDKAALELYPIKERLNKQGTGSYDANLPRRKAFINGAKWAYDNPQKVYIVLRCEGHDDYVEKVFVDKDKAIAYCKQYEGNPNEYGRYFEEMEVTI